MKKSLLESALCSMKSTAFAIISNDGKLFDASEGFLRLLPKAERSWISLNINRFFIQPQFEVLHASSKSISGYFTVGDVSGYTTTLIGVFYKENDICYFLGEQNADQDMEINVSTSKMIFELAETERKLSTSNKKLKILEKLATEKSLIDPLTKLGNRRYLEIEIDKEISRAKRGHTGLSFLMGDLDKFKLINDQYGHDVGDIVLREFAEVISKSIRKFDIAFRYGGEEFVILMPGVESNDAFSAAERIRLTLENWDFSPYPIKVTASFGVATLLPDEKSEALFIRADKAMYEAKSNGRNQVKVSKDQLSSMT